MQYTREVDLLSAKILECTQEIHQIKKDMKLLENREEKLYTKLRILRKLKKEAENGETKI